MISWTQDEYFFYMLFFLIPVGVGFYLLTVIGMMDVYVNQTMDKLVAGDPAKALAEVTRRNAKKVKQLKGGSFFKEIALRFCMVCGLGHKDWVVYGILAIHCLENPYRQEQIIELNRSTFSTTIQNLKSFTSKTQDGK